MNKLKYITPICLVLFLFIVSSSTVFAYSFGPPKERTGAPNESTCATAGCHTGNSLNATGGSLVLTVPKTYEPGEVYDIVVKLSRSGQKRWGFQMTALNGNNVSAGSFSKMDANTQLNSTDNKYIQHTSTGTAQGTLNMHSWMFRWTAPANDVGTITFYAAGNAANNANGARGDYIYTKSATSEVPYHGVSLQGVGNLTRQTTDASSGISYTVKVSNTGNISDTIGLTTSGDVSATLSQNTVSLSAGASTNVTVSISGSALTAAGEYDVNVNATSQGDSTKTAAITTTTTILPVYSISLVGVGSLTKETSDASAGVSYRVRVTNNGNTRDTIRLTTTGDVNATVSSATITLNRRSSRTLTLRISGTALTEAGEYEVKVKATSQGDDTITPEITTTTTILPVYGFSIAGVGDLESETSDGSDGVVYTLSITNDGNTNDVINLSTSGDADATLSSESVSLASGASEEVTLTVSADGLALAGVYEVKVSGVSENDNTKTAEETTTTTISAVYGFSIAGVGVLESETADGSGGVVYTLSITNDGNTNDVINLSTSGDADATLSSESVSLASGASEEVSLTVSAGGLALAGVYEVKVSGVSENDNTKTAEETTTTTISAVYGFSIAGVGVLESETADGSGGVSYMFTITNDGNTNDVINLSTSGDADATLSSESVSLASGASEEVSLTVSADGLTLAGVYEVKVSGISENDNTKTAEETTTTTISAVYGFSIAGVGDLESETADGSGGVSYMFTITNDGNTNDVINLSTSGDADATLSSESVSLASGASEEVSLTVSADGLALAGVYEVKVSGVSENDNTKTAEETTTTTISAVYGFSIVGVGNLESETADGSAGVVYTLSITNDGNTTDVINLSTSGDADATLSSESVSLASGASEEVSLTVSADGLTLAGVYEVKVSGISENDNTKTAEETTTTTISAVYGFSIAGVGDLESETSDGSDGVSYMFTITNDGNTTDVIDLSTSGDADATLSAESVSLASGASEEVSLTVSADGLTLAGVYEVKVSGISENDNTKTAEETTTTTISAVYGFSIAGVGDLESETSDGSGGVSYMFTITNDGNTIDVIDLSTSGDADATLSSESVSLASGASEEVSLTVSADGLALAGVYEVKVSGVSENDNTKTAEETTTTTISAVYGFSIAGVGVLESETSDGSDGVSYMFTITNDGNTTDVIDLSTSGDADATLSSESVSLASGASEEVSLTVSAGGLALAGVYEVKVSGVSENDNTKTAEETTTTTISAVYGFSIAGVGVLESETSDGSGGVVYTLSITNDGNTTDVINLSTSGDADATLSAESVSLASGASEEVTLTVSADGLTLAGVYAVKVSGISENDNTKTAEETTTTTISAVYGFSIAGVGNLESETSDGSDGVSYMFTITNDGNTTDVIDLSTSGDADATLSSESVSLASGASEEVSLTVSADGLALAGVYEVKVSGISENDNTKTAEETTTTTISAVYGFSIAGVGNLESETSDGSDGVSYMFTITNDGNTTDVIDLSTSGDADATLSSESVSLASGASEEVSLTVSADGLALAGVYEVKVSGISENDNTKTAEETTTTTISAVYGFSIAGVGDLESETSDGSDGVSYMFTITNDGNTTDVINLSTSGDADATLSAESVSLASGASEEVTLTISADGLTLAGVYEVKVTATSQSDSTKTSELSTTTTILPVYDISIAGVGDLESETADGSAGVSYMFTITNDGNTTDVIDLSTSGDADATLSSESVSLASGASEEVTLTVSADGLTLAGVYEVKVSGISENDNTKTAEETTTTTISAVYGFSIAGVGDLESETADGSDGVVYTLSITNDGNTTDVIDLSTSGDADATLSSESVSLASGASEEVSLTVSADGLMLAGVYQVKVTAISQEDNTISDEVSTVTTILSVYGVMLDIVGTRTGTTTDAVEGVTYPLKVTNSGNIEDTILLGSSVEIGIGGAVLGSFSKMDDEGPPTGRLEITLAPGGTEDVMFIASGDLLTQPGGYEIEVTATSKGDSTKSAAITTSTTIAAIPPVYGVTLDGEGQLSETTMGSTMDILTGVTYTLVVTNTGNTEDTILFGSSAMVYIEGSVLGSFSLSDTQESPTSQLKIIVPAEASETVLFTVSGDAFTKSGDYEIKVTATSQGDDTKTAELTTTTTITPFYSVKLEGKDILTGDTTDAIKGVSYVLVVSNEGNTDDTVVVNSSAEVGIEGNVLGSFTASSDQETPLSEIEVMLSPGTSTEVTFTAAGDFFTKSGDYEIKVTATSQGDDTKTAELTTTTTITPVYSVKLVGKDILTGDTTDAIKGVSYVLVVSNEGNTDDTVLLSSSSAIGIEGSVLGSFTASSDQETPLSEIEVMLSPRTSTEVTFTAAGDFFTKSGDYEIKVTATSQGDDTKTAELTTTTTITPVYSVKLVGKDALTGDTTDAVKGVSYVLVVSNEGNTDDTVVVNSSAEVGIEGNVLGSFTASSDQETPLSEIEVMLSPRTSTEVTFTAAGDFFTKPGDYEIKVTATSQGDNTKTAELTTTTTITPVYSVKLEGKDVLTGDTTDAVKGVSYVLVVSNEGNTDDTVLLSSSAEVGIEGNVLGSFTASSDQETPLSEIEVMLSPRTSTEVTFTAAGDFLTKPGDYEIKVTATSQGDNTKTAELTTTTTITPVYSVKLEGKDVLTGDTTDAVKGVSYVLVVSNEGNTDDTVLLSSSAEVGIEGNVLGSFTASSDQETPLNEIEVMLSRGASTEVTFTAAGDFFTKPGEYEIKVSATSQGDITKTAELTTTTTITPIYSVKLEGKDVLTGDTTDAVKGVSYVLVVSNEGNTDDTVLLSSSAEVGIEGNVLGSFTASSDQETPLGEIEVMLSRGASTEVTFTAAGDFFTKPGEYEITVTATSQGDNTKTAELTTTTTITPVYSVKLEGKDVLTGDTTDAVKGVSYVLVVSNEGNADDTVLLSSSSAFGIEGSVLGSFTASSDQEMPLSEIEVMLSPGTSTEVTFTAAGDFFTKSGDYEIKVSATSQGDNTKTAELTTTTTITPVYSVKLEGKDALTGDTTDAVKGVSYVLVVSNEGNTDDTVLLSSSSAFGIEGSVLGSFTASSDQEMPLSEIEVMLSPGTSTEVTFTAAGDFFTKSGDYEIKVSATSQGDNTKTAELTTTTTITPIYSVKLEGKDALTGDTTDAVKGVSYVLVVSNEGNTDDTVLLSSSSAFGIEGSVLGSFTASSDQEMPLSEIEVMLSPGTSTEVTFTAAGDFFTKSGDYEIKVSATSQGDNTKTAELTTTTTITPIYSVKLEGKDALTGDTIDAIKGVSYVLVVSNEGNTDDTVLLSSSAAFGIEGSVLGSFTASSDQEMPLSEIEVMLSPGTSTEVTFTAAGDFFTKPGEYEITVSATSQGDDTNSTMAAELTTITTISPVPWDVNADGTVNILDLVQVTNQLGESGEGLTGDVNMDGQVNILDLVQIVSYIGKTHAEIVQELQ